MDQTDILFTSESIGRLEIKNRFVRAATAERLADDEGKVTGKLVDFHARLADGGVGLQIIGHSYIEYRGKGHRYQTSIADDSCMPGLTRLADAVHAKNGTISLEINHTGAKNSVNPEDAVAPSAVIEPQTGNTPSALKSDEVWEIIRFYGAAARRARETGFDSLHVHGANGYLITQFGSPYSNRRSDEWGGNELKRNRFLMEVYREVRKNVGSDFPITWKLGVIDYVTGGVTLDEVVNRATILESEGLDAIEISCGIMPHGESALQYVALSKTRALRDLVIPRLYTPASEEAYYRPQARAIKKKLKIPLILVGGIRSTETMVDVVKSGDADFLSMARPFIREPDIVKQIQNGRHGLVDCTSCNLCRDIDVFELRCWRKNKIILMKGLYLKHFS